MIKKYRNKKLLELAREMPHCMLCGKFNNGDVVAAHSNSLLHGKGTGTKAHDFFVAFLCYECHRQIDQGKDWSREEKDENWRTAFDRSWIYMLTNDLVEVVV